MTGFRDALRKPFEQQRHGQRTLRIGGPDAIQRQMPRARVRIGLGRRRPIAPQGLAHTVAIEPAGRVRAAVAPGMEPRQDAIHILRIAAVRWFRQVHPEHRVSCPFCLRAAPGIQEPERDAVRSLLPVQQVMGGPSDAGLLMLQLPTAPLLGEGRHQEGADGKTPRDGIRQRFDLLGAPYGPSLQRRQGCDEPLLPGEGRRHLPRRDLPQRQYLGPISCHWLHLRKQGQRTRRGHPRELVDPARPACARGCMGASVESAQRSRSLRASFSSSSHCCSRRGDGWKPKRR